MNLQNVQFEAAGITSEQRTVVLTGSPQAPIYLKAVNLNVYNPATGYGGYRSGQIYLYDPGVSAAAMQLAHGALSKGRLSWQGDIRIDQSLTLYMQWLLADASDKCYAEIITDSVPGPLGGSSNEDHNVASYRAGKLRLVSVVGAADATTIDVRPPQYKSWEVIDAWATTDDGSARVTNWQFFDGTTTITKGGFSITSGQPVSLSASLNVTTLINPSLLSPLTLTYDCYAQVKAAALTAGKKITASLIVREMVDV